MMSASSGNMSIVQLALAAGCNINAQDDVRLRIIDYSIANNHLDVTGFLARRKRCI
jgi:ankyrin repeat protein